MSRGEVLTTRLGKDVDAEEAGHSVQVILVARHGQHLGDDRLLSPVSAELLDQFHKICRGRFSVNRKERCPTFFVLQLQWDPYFKVPLGLVNFDS